MIRRTLYICVLPCMLLLSGCLSTKLDADKKQHFVHIPYPDRVSRSKKVNLFFAVGVASITKQDKTRLVAFDWKQQGTSTFRLHLSGPAGLDPVLIQGFPPNSVTLWESNSKFINSNSLKKLMLQRFGWYLPLSAMRYWALGIQAPGIVGAKTFDKYGHLKTLHQRGWYIQYSQYANEDSIDVPRIIELQRGDLKIKLAIKHWYIYPILTPLVDYTRSTSKRNKTLSFPQ